MPTTSLELPTIPKSTVMDLRSKTTLDALHANSDMVPAHSRIHTTVGLLLKLHAETGSEIKAMDVGAEVAEALFFKSGRELGRAIPTKPQTERVVKGLIDVLTGRELADEYVDMSIAAMEADAPETLLAYEQITVAHLDGHDKAVKNALRGAAVLHCALHSATNIDEPQPLAEVISLSGR